MINRNHLALFHAVVEEGGFGRAARRLRISQPAVSVQISQLEDVLGLLLIERSGRSIRLTEAGEKLAVYARRIALLEAEAAQAMEELSQLRGGRLRIGASSTIAAYLLPQLICEFRTRWPDIGLEMQAGNSTQIQQQLLDGILDLGLVEGLESHPELEAQPFRDDQLVPIAAWGHPILSGKRPTLKAFLKYPLILREAGSGTREATTRFLNTRGHTVEPALSFGSTEAVKGAVAAGLGLSFVSSLTVAGDVLLKRLAVIPVSDARVIRHPFSVLQRPGRTALPAVTAFLTIIRNR